VTLNRLLERDNQYIEDEDFEYQCRGRLISETHICEAKRPELGVVRRRFLQYMRPQEARIVTSDVIDRTAMGNPPI
jgi:hypothetical protein